MGNNPSAINVTCTNSAPYTIGLTPSNGNQAGSGEMSGTSGNKDQTPYQLRSTDGANGDVWGNIAIPDQEGSVIKLTGDGKVQNKTAYVTVPSADFKPDNYSDIVSIQVDY